MRVTDTDFNNILLDKKSYKIFLKNILVYGILYKTFMRQKPLRIRVDKINGFIEIFGGITSTDKIFEKNSSFHVKYHTTGKVRFLF